MQPPRSLQNDRIFGNLSYFNTKVLEIEVVSFSEAGTPSHRIVATLMLRGLEYIKDGIVPIQSFKGPLLTLTGISDLETGDGSDPSVVTTDSILQ